MNPSSLKTVFESPEKVAIIKRVTFLVGVLAMFVGSICYMVMSDLGFGNESTWLILATLLSMGSAACQFFSSNMRDMPVKQIVLRSIGIALGIGYVLFLHLFTGTAFYNGLGYKVVPARNACMIVSFIFAYVALVAQIANLVFIVTIKEE